MPPINYRNAADYDRNAASLESAYRDDSPSLTKQSFKDECDINLMMKKFKVTGHMPANLRIPTYGDFEDIGTYQDAMNALISAQASFNDVPSDIRARFGNDPAQFVDFCSQESNREELMKMGLVKPPAKEMPIPVSIISQAAPAASVAAIQPSGNDGAPVST